MLDQIQRKTQFRGDRIGCEALRQTHRLEAPTRQQQLPAIDICLSFPALLWTIGVALAYRGAFGLGGRIWIDVTIVAVILRVMQSVMREFVGDVEGPVLEAERRRDQNSWAVGIVGGLGVVQQRIARGQPL